MSNRFSFVDIVAAADFDNDLQDFCKLYSAVSLSTSAEEVVEDDLVDDEETSGALNAFASLEVFYSNILIYLFSFCLFDS